MQRLDKVEADVGKLADLKSQMATIEERTKNTADNMNSMRADMSTITSHLLDETRSFNPQAPRRAR